MKTLREQLNDILRPENVAGEFTLYQAAQLAHVARKMDALLEECAPHILKIADYNGELMLLSHKLKRDGYDNDTDR